MRYIKNRLQAQRPTEIYRYFVLEINSGSLDLLSIVDNLKQAGFKFVLYL
jgi:hypothetical protein